MQYNLYHTLKGRPWCPVLQVNSCRFLSSGLSISIHSPNDLSLSSLCFSLAASQMSFDNISYAFLKYVRASSPLLSDNKHSPISSKIYPSSSYPLSSTSFFRSNCFCKARSTSFNERSALAAHHLAMISSNFE